MARTATFALALLAALATAQAAHIYTGPENFINTFLNENVTVLELDGATLRLITAADSYGLKLANLAALHITLQPCTILQPHIHPHAEFAFTISGAVTHSVVYNNASLTSAFENTVKDVDNPGYAVFPTGQLHVTQNEGCKPAEVLSVFPTGAVDAYFFPFTEAYLPENTVASYFGGQLSNADLWKPLATAPLAGCSCEDRRRA